MRYFILLLSLLVLGCNTNKEAVTAAESQDLTPDQRRAAMQAERMDGLGELTEVLDLTETQQEEIEALTIQFRTQVRDLREKHGDDRPALRAALSELRVAHQEAMQDILSEEQYRKFEAYQAERRQERRDRRSNR